MLVTITVLVFVGQLASMVSCGTLTGLTSGGNRAQLLQFGAMLISADHTLAEPFRLVSAVFVHIGVLHIVMNMLTFVNAARVVEPGVGTARFVIAYVACGVAGFGVNIAFDALFPSRSIAVTAGASGAVFGVMGMVIGWLLQMRDKRWRSYAGQAVFFAVIVNLMGFSINNGAHIGGLITGAVLGFVFAKYPQPKQPLLANIGAAAAIVLVLASLFLSQRSADFGRNTCLRTLVDAPQHKGPPEFFGHI